MFQRETKKRKMYEKVLTLLTYYDIIITSREIRNQTEREIKNMRTYDYKREGKTRRTYTFRMWEGCKIIAVCEKVDGNDIPDFCKALKAEGYTER